MAEIGKQSLLKSPLIHENKITPILTVQTDMECPLYRNSDWFGKFSLEAGLGRNLTIAVHSTNVSFQERDWFGASCLSSPSSVIRIPNPRCPAKSGRSSPSEILRPSTIAASLLCGIAAMLVNGGFMACPIAKNIGNRSTVLKLHWK